MVMNFPLDEQRNDAHRPQTGLAPARREMQPNRNPAFPEGRPITDHAGSTTIGWCWWDGETLMATDDRWGIQTSHTGSQLLAIDRAVRSVRIRCLADTREDAEAAVRCLELHAQLQAIAVSADDLEHKSDAIRILADEISALEQRAKERLS